mmetsp:Transcript_88182/g.249709  ORF Transcript_88182/g.249709 Transcript_88182/m.249709 type:complete len:339 (-) Transcript_88182:1348-2364(-)
MPAELSAHWRAHSSRALADPGGLDDALSIHGLQPREVGGRVLLFHVHHLLVELHLVLVYLQLPAQDPAGAEELVLVGPALGARQAVEDGLFAVRVGLLRLHQDLLAVSALDDQDNDVHHTDRRTCAILHQCRLSLDQLGRKLLQRLRPWGAVLGDVDASLGELLLEGLLAEADGRLHQGGDLLLLRRELHLLLLGLLGSHPLEILQVAHVVRGLPVAVGRQPNLLEQVWVADGDGALHDLLAVHGRDAGERRRLDFLLHAHDLQEVEIDALWVDLHEPLQDTLRGLACVLVRLLLRSREAVGFPLPAVGELLVGLYDHALFGVVGALQNEHHEVADAH